KKPSRAPVEGAEGQPGNSSRGGRRPPPAGGDPDAPDTRPVVIDGNARERGVDQRKAGEVRPTPALRSAFVPPDRSIGPMAGTPFLPKGIGSCGYSGRSVIKVSIVVPVYNGGPYLDLCAPSLLRQSIGADAYEIIYVDDGSTDDSAQRLDRLAAEHRHVRVIHQENPRTGGVRVARGEYA